MKVSKPYLEHCFTRQGVKNLDCGYSAVQFMLIISEIIRSCAITNYITKHQHQQRCFVVTGQYSDPPLTLVWPGHWDQTLQPTTLIIYQSALGKVTKKDMDFGGLGVWRSFAIHLFYLSSKWSKTPRNATQWEILIPFLTQKLRFGDQSNWLGEILQSFCFNYMLLYVSP